MLKNKDILGLRDMSKEEIESILETAKDMKAILKSNNKSVPYLKGKTAINLFFENSTRTRTSFELASKYLGSVSANIASSSSSVNKGETLLDTARTIDAMSCDFLVMRHSQSGAPHYLSDKVSACVINAGDGMNEHPTQALLDMFTAYEHFGKLDGLKIAILGDACHSRVVRSNIWGWNKFGSEVYVAGPSTLVPKEMANMGCKLTSIAEACQDADVVMALRLQLERQKKSMFPSVPEYYEYYALTPERLELAKPDSIVMHPGPCNRGVEMPSFIHDHPRSVIEEQVTNGVAVRMAILQLLNLYRNNKM